MGTSACTLLAQVERRLSKETREEISPKNLSGKTVRFRETFNPSTPEYPDLQYDYRENELRLTRDLTMAREVQQQLLHREIRDVPGIDLATACVPAREPGGDFYDLLPYGSGRLALALGDVSGKGSAAALLSALAIGILDAQTVDHAFFAISRNIAEWIDLGSARPAGPGPVVNARCAPAFPT